MESEEARRKLASFFGECVGTSEVVFRFSGGASVTKNLYPT